MSLIRVSSSVLTPTLLIQYSIHLQLTLASSRMIRSWRGGPQPLRAPIFNLLRYPAYSWSNIEIVKVVHRISEPARFPATLRYANTEEPASLHNLTEIRSENWQEAAFSRCRRMSTARGGIYYTISNMQFVVPLLRWLSFLRTQEITQADLRWRMRS